MLLGLCLVADHVSGLQLQQLRRESHAALLAVELHHHGAHALLHREQALHLLGAQAQVGDLRDVQQPHLAVVELDEDSVGAHARHPPLHQGAALERRGRWGREQSLTHDQLAFLLHSVEDFDLK